jgi:aerobic carbon-monoxide dehydrogenase large subunit
MTATVFGSGIRRREDPRLVTGTAAYTDDIVLPRMVHAAILRSPHAHARIKGIDTAAAKAAPGVLEVFTAADTEGALKPVPCAWLVPNSDLKVAAYSAIAKDTVRYVGDCVAVVVAENRYQAQDARLRQARPSSTPTFLAIKRFTGRSLAVTSTPRSRRRRSSCAKGSFSSD